MSTSPDSRIAPTRVRYGVLIFVCLLSMITYIDRAWFPNAEKEVGKSLGLTDISDLAIALAAFQLAYALFEIPTGWLGDVYGPRKTLIRIVIWWSTFIAITGLVGMSIFGVTLIGFWVLVGIRFLFGMGEAGAYPNITRALYNWFPSGERGFAQGAVWMSARFMGGLTPLIWLFVVDYLGVHWRVSFGLFGLVGVIWCLAFLAFFRNRPEEHPSVNAAEIEYIRAGGTNADNAHAAVPWKKLFLSANLWALCGMYFCMNYGWYFFMYYLPSFMVGQFNASVDPETATFGQKVVNKLITGSPLLLGMVGCLLGGWLSDRHIRKTGDRRWGRRTYGMIGFGMASLSFAVIVFGPQTALVFAVCIACAGFFNDLALATCWATAQDMGRRYAAIVAGCMNMIGNLGGALTTAVTGWIVASYIKGLSGDELELARNAAYRINFMLFGSVYFIGMLLWLRIDASKPVIPEAE
ncbi:MFS transporter [Tuwongella immobilis]|uniref:Major facilitator superfamily (MFS) profile domain-containing protein n=1 Tax=Tuwongella immobilis TaxID=692036 RepID=A0A6C2YL10_9BACT|nr:MFS transporter [Tuwongella immobilis]VIP02064.1 mfs transporter : Sugar phosphate permease OS=Singulisphaera acidiphila (strain ATCC BAA-1392 / DSM 18658 / VKM B-2454 / MOB10) GN=Sinac_6136 PE=4 SV=1: MFS_1 [Tuwongella immobilis]VTS00279.1 mfs transporter : Sugar phosphate permease OS=Singulisphaera acidiphila (strain ATCC BAA-1392 / DSM 18658 / VKM B-2454 / MOB10) GN=Sinac_6136 PE=4 SV=1: MFS_1 [Tuwongella immobilis]